MKIKLLKIEEDRRRILYKIDQEEYIINGKIFKVKKSTANLSSYLNSIDSSLIKILNLSVDCKCKNCLEYITRNRFERNVFIAYKFCNECDKRNVLNKYNIVKCICCNKEILYKDIKYSTCVNKKCLEEYSNIINNKIKETHWTLNDHKNDITIKKSIKRKENDIKFCRKYVAWNKDKTGIYSKETIEKLRNAAINQMKNGKIKKTGIETIFEELLKSNNIDYTYSFIYENRQFDFIIKDYNIVVEIQGDYWHSNPKFWDVYDNDKTKKKLYETQIMKIKDDVIKKNIIERSKYDFVSFWEYDIHNNISEVEKTLFELINKNKIKNGKNL